MKKLFVLFALIGTLPDCAAQADYDSLVQKMLRMDVAINNIHNNMRSHHAQFKTGTAIIATGVALTIAGTVLATADDNRLPLVYVGGALTIVGGIVQIDSHKWLGRGAWKRESLFD